MHNQNNFKYFNQKIKIKDKFVLKSSCANSIGHSRYVNYW